MGLQTQMAMFVGGFAVCLAIMIPLMSRRSEQPAASNTEPSINVPPKPAYQKSKPYVHPEIKPSKPTKKSWLVYLAPVYAFGVCVYVLYIIYRITTKKFQKEDATNRGLRRGKNKQNKAVLSQEEINVLENRLSASERAVDEILRKARSVMTEVYQKDVEDEESSLSDSSDFTNSSDGEERGGPKITELVTTSSANNDTHQDTSSTSEGRILMHQRKRHKIKPHHETLDNSRSSSEEDESDICHRGADISDLNSPDIETDDDSDDEEDASTCYDLSDLPSEDSKEENNILLSQPSGKENVPLQKRSAEPRIGDSQTPQGTPVSPSPKVAQSPSREVLEEEKVALEERIDEFGKTAQGIGESLENEIEKKVFLNDREKLLSTTKEVLSAMGEIREFIKEQKSE